MKSTNSTDKLESSGVTGSVRHYLASALAFMALTAAPAFAATVSFSINMTGSTQGAPTANGGVSFTAQTAQGSLPPFGSASASFQFTATPPGMTFTLANGATVFTSGTLISSPTLADSYAGTVTGGTGVFTGATGTFQASLTPNFTASSANTLVYTLAGTGTIDAPNVAAGVTVLPASLQMQVQTGSPAVSSSLILNNQGLAAVPFTTSASVASGSNWLSVSPSTGTAPALAPSALQVTADPSGLALGVYQGQVTVNESGVTNAIPVRLIVGPLGAFLELSQTGEFFQAALGGTVPPAATFQVTNTGAGNLTGLTATTSVTGSVANWLTVSLPQGFGSQTQTTASVSVNPSSLVPGTYFGRVDFNMPTAVNSPQSVTVQMQVTSGPLPTFSPAQLIFQTGVPGQLLPVPQRVTVTNIGRTTTSFTITPGPVLGPPGWVTISQTSGTLSPGAQTTLTLTPVASCFNATTYLCNGFAFGFASGIDFVVNFPSLGYTYNLNQWLIDCGPVCGQGGSGGIQPAPQQPQTAHLKADAGSGCTPTQLQGVFTSIPVGFQATVGQPAPLVAEIIDDCGQILNTGTAIVTFSSGDPAMALIPSGSGQWSGTWTPRHASSSNQITLQAVSPTGTSGLSTLSSSVAANATTPIVSSGGVVSAASGLAPIAPGDFVAIFGQNMGSGLNTSPSTPYLTSLGGTQAFLGGQPMPLYFTSDGQIDAIVPYGVPINTVQQLIVQNGLAYSQPEPVTIGGAAPGVFTQNQSGVGPGSILGLPPGGVAQLNTASNPASAGDVLVIFCTGLGATSPAVAAGAAAPTLSLSNTVDTVTVTVGGRNAQVLFAGLAPGYVGLYQVNAIVPSGVAAGPSVPVVMTAAGAASAPVTVAIH